MQELYENSNNDIKTNDVQSEEESQSNDFHHDDGGIMNGHGTKEDEQHSEDENKEYNIEAPPRRKDHEIEVDSGHEESGGEEREVESVENDVYEGLLEDKGERQSDQVNETHEEVFLENDNQESKNSLNHELEDTLSCNLASLQHDHSESESECFENESETSEKTKYLVQHCGEDNNDDLEVASQNDICCNDDVETANSVFSPQESPYEEAQSDQDYLNQKSSNGETNNMENCNELQSQGTFSQFDEPALVNECEIHLDDDNSEEINHDRKGENLILKENVTTNGVQTINDDEDKTLATFKQSEDGKSIALLGVLN